VDGPILGNGDLGVALSGPPEAQRYWIGKCDFWKAKPHFPNGGPRLIGGIDLLVPDLDAASYHIEQRLCEADVIATFQTPDRSFSIHSWVPANENLLVITASNAGAPVNVQPRLWIQKSGGSETEECREGGIAWAHRRFESKDLEWPTGAAIALSCLGGALDGFTLEDRQSITLVAAVCTNHDREDFGHFALNRVRDLTQAELETIQTRHLAWWKAFWSKSCVQLPDPLIEQFWYGSHYIMASCSRNPRFPPGLLGHWITTDRPVWASDYHLNYNHQAPWWGVYSSNHVDLAEPYDAPILEYVPQGRENASKSLNCRGVYYDVGIGPKGFCSSLFPDKDHMQEHYGGGPYGEIEGGHMFLGQKSNALFCTANMFLRFDHTRDLDYLRKVYPFLIQVADFWEDYLVFEDGRYVDRNDNLHEVGPWQGEDWEQNYGDVNPILSLGLLRMFYSGMLDASCALDIDRDRRETWRHILEHLSGFPTVEVDGQCHFRGAEGTGSGARNIDLDWVMAHGLIWPSRVFGLDSEPEWLELLRARMERWPEDYWIHHGNNSQTVFAAAALIGLDPDKILALLRHKIEAYRYPNLLISQGGGGIEACSGVPATINFMLLQGRGGVLRLFPVWPRNMDARFERLRAPGAFLVSSAMKKERVQHAVVESERGGSCQVLNPWPGENVCLVQSGRPTSVHDGEILTIEMAIGERVALVPRGGVLPENRA
jgi:hypothetical protein